MFVAAIVFLALLASALAQHTAIIDNDSQTTETTQTALLWLPMNGPDDLSVQASVISASPEKTTYVLRCKSDNTNALCGGYDPPITMTQGASTIAFVHTYFRNPEETATLIKPITIQCRMGGAVPSKSKTASSALCTIASDISGLGIIASTSRLASSEITYRPVTVTAGLARPVAETTPTPTATVVTTSSTAAAGDGPEVTAMALGGAVWLAIIANV